MKILLTGAPGSIGRAIYVRLCSEHEIVGYDSSPTLTTDIVASLEDSNRVRAALEKVNVVIHTAALHAPHVGIAPDSAFQSVASTKHEGGGPPSVLECPQTRRVA